MGAREIESVRIGDDVAWTASSTRVVALDLSRIAGRPIVLEASAAAVWKEIADEGPISPENLVLRVARAFGVEAESIRDSVATLLAELESRSLIVR